MSKAEIENLYGFKITNFLEYHRLKILVTKFLNKLKITAGKFEWPCVPHLISIIIQSKNVTKTFYSILDDTTIDAKFKYRWNEELGINIQEKNWELIFQICFKTVEDNDII